MKITKTFAMALCTILSAITFGSFGQSTDAVKTDAVKADAVKEANKLNDKKADKGMLNEDDAEFIVKSADARMMDMREGKLATEKGTSSEIKEYGALMVKDQTMLLSKIKSLAGKKHITVPDNISSKKEKGREDLSKLNGKDFDEKFVKMMILDHERDVKIFKKATESKDENISAFANEYLPKIQSHLDKIKGIKDMMK